MVVSSRAVVGSHYEQATAKKPGSIAIKDRVSLDCTSSRCSMTSTSSHPNCQRGGGRGGGTRACGRKCKVDHSPPSSADLLSPPIVCLSSVTLNSVQLKTHVRRPIITYVCNYLLARMHLR